MAEELQSLLEKIHRDGIEKAAAERDEMLAKARSEAAAVVAAAREEAKTLQPTSRMSSPFMTRPIFLKVLSSIFSMYHFRQPICMASNSFMLSFILSPSS